MPHAVVSHDLPAGISTTTDLTSSFDAGVAAPALTPARRGIPSLPLELWSMVAFYAYRPAPKVISSTPPSATDDICSSADGTEGVEEEEEEEEEDDGSPDQDGEVWPTKHHQDTLAAMMRVNSTLNYAAGPILYSRPVVYSRDMASFVLGYQHAPPHSTATDTDTACGSHSSPGPLTPRIALAKTDLLHRVGHIYLEGDPIEMDFDAGCAAEADRLARDVSTEEETQEDSSAADEENRDEDVTRGLSQSPQESYARMMTERLCRVALDLDQTLQVLLPLHAQQTGGGAVAGHIPSRRLMSALETVSVNALRTRSAMGYARLAKALSADEAGTFRESTKSAGLALARLLYALAPRTVCVVPLHSELVLPDFHHSSDIDPTLGRDTLRRSKRRTSRVTWIIHRDQSSDEGVFRHSPLVMGSVFRVFERGRGMKRDLRAQDAVSASFCANVADTLRRFHCRYALKSAAGTIQLANGQPGNGHDDPTPDPLPNRSIPMPAIKTSPRFYADIDTACEWVEYYLSEMEDPENDDPDTFWTPFAMFSTPLTELHAKRLWDAVHFIDCGIHDPPCVSPLDEFERLKAATRSGDECTVCERVVLPCHV